MLAGNYVLGMLLILNSRVLQLIASGSFRLQLVNSANESEVLPLEIHGPLPLTYVPIVDSPHWDNNTLLLKTMYIRHTTAITNNIACEHTSPEQHMAGMDRQHISMQCRLMVDCIQVLCNVVSNLSRR